MKNIHTVFWSLYTAVGDTRMPCLKIPRMDNTPELAGGKYPLRDVGLAKGVSQMSRQYYAIPRSNFSHDCAASFQTYRPKSASHVLATC